MTSLTSTALPDLGWAAVMDVDALEAAARETLSAAAFDYIAGGADAELTLADNVAAWGRRRLRPRVLRDVSAVDTATTVLGTPVRLPVLVAPVGYQRLAHPDGETEMARGAAAAGSVLIASTLATTRLEDIAAAAPDSPRWMQVYVQRDRGATAALVGRAVAAGYRALVFTVDLPVLGFRRRDERNSFTLPPGLRIANLSAPMPDVPGSSGLTAQVGRDLDPGLTFDDIGWLASISGLPVLVKGVLRGDDARACVEAGAAGVVVSNHGGRQLDSAVATADALAEVVAAVAGSGPPGAEVYVDGGIRGGVDVLKALALGARAVLVGRPAVWGLVAGASADGSAGGAGGVQGVLDGLGVELARAMALCGASRVADVTADLLAP